jgi:hypothetical protein
LLNFLIALMQNLLETIYVFASRSVRLCDEGKLTQTARHFRRKSDGKLIFAQRK